MPKRSRTTENETEPPRDENRAAKRVLDRLIAKTEELEDAGEKNPAAVALGRRGGKKGGPARAAKMTKEERSESARKAAEARWSKKDE